MLKIIAMQTAGLAAFDNPYDAYRFHFAATAQIDRTGSASPFILSARRVQ